MLFEHLYCSQIIRFILFEIKSMFGCQEFHNHFFINSNFFLLQILINCNFFLQIKTIFSSIWKESTLLLIFFIHPNTSKTKKKMFPVLFVIWTNTIWDIFNVFTLMRHRNVFPLERVTLGRKRRCPFRFAPRFYFPATLSLHWEIAGTLPLRTLNTRRDNIY